MILKLVRKHVCIVANNGREKPPKGLERLLEALNFGHSGLETKLWIVIVPSLLHHPLTKLNRIMG